MKYIKLTKGRVAKVDDADYERLNQHPWYCTSRGYAARRKGASGTYYMHREILDPPRGFQSDHINGDKLDNRRVNLRICTEAQNHANRKLSIRNNSGYIGVSWNKQMGKWKAGIKNTGKALHLGYFEDKLEAATAYNKAAIALKGEFARLNDL